MVFVLTIIQHNDLFNSIDVDIEPVAFKRHLLTHID